MGSSGYELRTDLARGQRAVDVGMMLEFLIPGVEDAKETDLGAQMPGVTGDFE